VGRRFKTLAGGTPALQCGGDRCFVGVRFAHPNLCGLKFSFEEGAETPARFFLAPPRPGRKNGEDFQGFSSPYPHRSLSPLGEEMRSFNAIHLRVLLEGNAVRILDEWT
jgi:hypothetical protein